MPTRWHEIVGPILGPKVQGLQIAKIWVFLESFENSMTKVIVFQKLVRSLVKYREAVTHPGKHVFANLKIFIVIKRWVKLFADGFVQVVEDGL